MIKMPPRAAKILVVLACSLGMASVALGQSFSVNYRGQQQEDLTCMQASEEIGGQTVVYRNDPSTNCFGFPSIQFDDTPVVGGKPNSFTVDWSLMVEELQMQDDDRLHIHLPGFTGGHNTFGIMGPAIDSVVKGAKYTPNFKSEFVKDDVATTGERADFGALVGIWGISCGTEQNLYMDRAKVDNLRTAEWDPATEMLKVVLKGRRYGPSITGRHDGYTGVPGDLGRWASTVKTSLGLPIPFSDTAAVSCTENRNCAKGNHLQAMEYSREGPSWANPKSVANFALDNTASGREMATAAIVSTDTVSYGNDGFIRAPGFRVCGIYVDSTKLYREQLASKITNGLGPLPPYGGIGKNWYKAAFIRRYASTQCSGGFTNTDGKVTRPGMNPESCKPSTARTTAALALFWQVPFDGDTERVVGFQFTSTDQMLPVNKGDSPAGTLVAPSFTYARAKGKTNGPNKDNCITVTLMPSVTLVSGSAAATQITIEGLTGSGSSDDDQLPLYMDDGCTNTKRFTDLVGSNGAPIRNFRPVNGGGIAVPDTNKQSYRPFGQANRLATGAMWTDTLPALADSSATTLTGGLAVASNTQYYDDVDWHTRANRGTMTALTQGDPQKDAGTAGFFGKRGAGSEGTGSLAGVKGVLDAADAKTLGSKLSSPVGTLAAGDGNGKFEKTAGRLTVNLSPGYFLQKGEIVVFSFLLQNSAEAASSKGLTVSATGSYCDSENGFCDGNSEKTLNIQGNAIASGGKLLETKPPSFVTSKIFQASSDPDSLTTIFVTLRTNVDLRQPDASADAKITISGLCGFETGTDVQLFQNQKSGGLPFDNKYPIEAVRSKNDLPGLGQDDSKHITALAEYNGAIGQLKIKLGNVGFVAEKDYAFAFQLQTKQKENSACVPKISSAGGSETVAEQDFGKATNVGKVDAPQFTTLKIGQVTTRPDVPNFLCVTLKHNFEFYTDSAVTAGNTQQTAGYVESKITISGLTGTQAESTPVNGAGYALAYCPTELPYFDDRATQHTSTQFQPETSTAFAYKRYKTFTDPSCISPAAGGQSCIPGNPFSSDSALDPTMAGRSWFGGQVVGKDRFAWDQATGTAVLTVDPDITASKVTEPVSPKGGIPKNAEIVFALPLQNSKGASDCKAVKFESSGKIVQQATMVTTRTGRALQDGEQDGDACPLKVYAPGFLVKRITQSTSVTGDDNLMTVSLRTNVDFASVASGQASYITISGLTGTATGDKDLGVTAPNFRFSPRFEGNDGVWTQADGKLILKIDAGVCQPPTVWAAGSFWNKASGKEVQAGFEMGGSDPTGLTVQNSGVVVTSATTPNVITPNGFLGTSRPSTCIKAGFLYVFTFTVLNPGTEQSAPTVQIQGRFRDANNNEVVIAPVTTDAPISDDLDKIPMRISDQTLTTFKIGQLVPAPGATNVICVTLQTSKDIESKDSELLSTITISGLTGFNADAQDLQLYKNDGVTKITPEAGNPKDSDAYSVGGVFKARNTADTATNIGFVRYTGTTDGKVTMEIVGRVTDTTVTHAKHMQKNVDHKFCFRLKNPDTPMACKDVQITVANQGKISTVKAKLDVTTTIEDYPSRSACPGYVAAPGFVVKSWRSSSNITGDVAVIHMQLASNYELESGDKVTVSGLTSYTRACPSPPCDVGITVSRVAVARKFGKPYVNGARNVKGFGKTDAGATAADRQNFALAIQSFDLSGEKDDGTRTSTFGDNAAWGKTGDTEATASTLTFTVAKAAMVAPADIKQSSDATLYEVVFKLTNKNSAVSDSTIKVAITEGQKQYEAEEMNTGKAKSQMGINTGGGGMTITYTTMKTIFGGESLILTLPKFSRDSNGMLFGVTSAPSEAFITYSTWADWKAYGTDEDYARAFFTNGWVADGVNAKSGDSGQTGERWNFPNVNAKVTTDADYNHDTGVLVLDSADPGVGVNKDYWYAATENNLYEGRVTPVALLSTRTLTSLAGVTPLTGTGVTSNPPTVQAGAPLSGQNKPGQVNLPEATADYYLDNGEALDPIMGAVGVAEAVGADATAGFTVNGYNRPVAAVLSTDALKNLAAVDNTRAVTNPVAEPEAGLGEVAVGIAQRYNNLPAPMPTAVHTPQDNYVGTPPFRGIPAKYQPSRRDNFYKGMLMKCWIGASAKTDYSEDVTNDGTLNIVAATQYRPVATGQTELLPPPFRTPASAFGDQLVNDNAAAPQPYLTAADITNGQAFAKAGVSRILETRVIQASFRQIDYIPRKKGGCHFDSVVNTATLLSAARIARLGGGPVQSPTLVQPAAANRQRVGCQDEVPGFPAIVRLESPFSRPLDPDTLCYIQRKSHVGVYTGMTAMVGQREYTLKQGAANMYTVSHVADDMEDANGNAVDRMVPRSYSTEDAGLSKEGLRGDGNTFGFFKDGVGLSGQPYTIYSQLELVAQKGATVSIGETVTITIPTSSQIFAPADMNAPITPSVDSKPLTLADATRISHVLLVPLSPACSIVGAYGVPSRCQSGNGKGGAFDLMLSTKWPYAYDKENGNDITGYPMTVFGGQSTVIKTMADKHSQDLPIRPLEGAIGDTVAGGADLTGVLNPKTGTHTMIEGSVRPLTGGRVQSSTATGQATGSFANGINGDASSENPIGAGRFVLKDPNAVIVGDFTVVKELDAIALTSGTARTSATKAPRLPNAPITLVNGGCGTVSDGLAATLPYAVCLSLGGGVAHNQELVAGTEDSGLIKPTNTIGDEVGFSTTTAPNIVSRVGAQGVTTDNPSYADAGASLFRPKANQAGNIVVGPQSITGEIGQQVTPVVADKHAFSKAYGSAPATPDYGTYPTVLATALPNANPKPKLSFFEEAGDNLGLGAFLIVGVYKQGTSDRFVWSTQGNKGTLFSAIPRQTDTNANLVVQRWLGTSREVIPLSDIPSGLIGGDLSKKPSSGYPAPAGNVPRYQARIGGGYSIGRFSYGVSNIMRVRADVTSMAQPTGLAAWTSTSNTLGATLAQMPKDGFGVKDSPTTSFMAVPHHIANQPGSHLTGHSQDLTPTVQEALVFGRSTLPLPQVIHTAKHTAGLPAQANTLTRGGTCGVIGNPGGPANPVIDGANQPAAPALLAEQAVATTATREGCLATEFNIDQPFSRNVYIEKGMDVYIVSSVFDTLIQRPEPPRKHLSRTINNAAQVIAGNAAQLSSGFYATTLRGGAPVGTPAERVAGDITENGDNLDVARAVAVAGDVREAIRVAAFSAARSVAGSTGLGAVAAGDAAAVPAAVVADVEAAIGVADSTIAAGVKAAMATAALGVVGATTTATTTTTTAAVNSNYGSDQKNYFPGDATASATAPLDIAAPLGQAQGDFIADMERIGIIQTLGTPIRKGTGSVAAYATVPGVAATAPVPSLVENQYGFDQDFRLYSVLGPFMRPARIKDVYDGSKIAGAAQSKFPGILTVHGGTSEIDIYDSRIPIVTELDAGVNVNSFNNNALWSMAPVSGTSYAKAGDRTRQYHTYVEADKVLTFCNPLQGDLNNAPGSAIMTDISDSPGGVTTLLPLTGAAPATTQSPLGTINRQLVGNGDAAKAPGVWTVPRRHSLCRKMVTGNPLVTDVDMKGEASVGGVANLPLVTEEAKRLAVVANGTPNPTEAQILAQVPAAKTTIGLLGLSPARARFTESVQFNNVLNQDPSPNMRGMVTYVEPTKITVTTGSVAVNGVCKVPKITKEKKAGCTTLKIELKSGSSVEVAEAGKPEWFSVEATEAAYADAADFDATKYPAMLKDKDGKDIAQADRKYGLNWYDKRLCLGAFLKTVVSSPPAGASPHKFLIKHKAVREVAPEVLASIDTKLNGNRRRSLLATACPSGFDARLIVIGTPLSTACECPKSCGQDLAECPTDKNGTNTWNQVQLLERVCREEAKKSDYDPTGAIVGGVLGGFFGLLLLLLLAYFCCFRKKEVPPTARPVPMQEPAKPLAPVYLPQPYPALPEQFAPAPMPAYPGMEGVVQPTGQPMLYSSMQGVPYLQPGMETYPPQPGGYPAPYGVVPQPAYGI